MEDPSGPYRIGLIIVLMMCSALFSASETALFAMPKAKLKEVAKKDSTLGRVAASFVSEPERLLSTILVSNTLVNVLFTSTLTVIVIAGLKMAREASEGVAAISAFVLLLVFGEIGPKTLASARPQKVLSVTHAPLLVVLRLLWPLTALLNYGRKLFMGLFPDTEDTITVSQEQLVDTAVDVGEQTGTVTQATSSAIRNIFAADDTPVRNVMTPRAQIHAVSERDTFAEVANIMVSTGLSRLPVYRENLDNLIGIIHLKDLLPDPVGNHSISDFLRPIHKVRASDSVTKVLRDLRQRQLHLCAVHNSEGRVIGICTVEDLVEEIVGEIADEHDSQYFAAGGSES